MKVWEDSHWSRKGDLWRKRVLIRASIDWCHLGISNSDRDLIHQCNSGARCSIATIPFTAAFCALVWIHLRSNRGDLCHRRHPLLRHPGPLQREMQSVKFAVCNVKCVACSLWCVQCSVCSVLCMQCKVCSIIACTVYNVAMGEHYRKFAGFPHQHLFCSSVQCYLSTL